MRMERYRSFSSSLHASLRSFLDGAAVEKASCDDFYADITAASSLRSQQLAGSPALSSRLHIATSASGGENQSVVHMSPARSSASLNDSVHVWLIGSHIMQSY